MNVNIIEKKSRNAYVDLFFVVLFLMFSAHQGNLEKVFRLAD